MEQNFRKTNMDQFETATLVNENKLLRSSFAWMTLAMLITTLTAVGFASIEPLRLFLKENRVFLMILVFLPLVFVIAIRAGFEKFNYLTLLAIFLSYSAINGITFSVILLSYEPKTLLRVFLSTTALFAVMSIAGYTTNTDLTKLGRILMIGLIGIIIASIINFFMQSSGMEYIISILGVVIFTGLTAYDVQKIKNMGNQIGNDGALISKMGIMGALTLYLDFINLFLMLLRLFGNRR
jgi:uncharacterized protein